MKTKAGGKAAGHDGRRGGKRARGEDDQAGEGGDRPRALLSTPHDALFHFGFMDPRHASAELRCVLPPALSSAIDWPSLALEPGRFVDAKLANRYSDLLFSARLGQRQAYIYVLFEHLSSRKRLALLTLLEYMVKIWQSHAKRRPGVAKLPLILPVVLHHSGAGWTAATRFRDLLEIEPELLEHLAPLIPDFRAVVDDISGVSSGALKGRPMTPEGRLILFCLRLGRRPEELLQWLPEWADVLLAVAGSPGGGLFISAAMEYLAEVTRLGEAGVKMAMQNVWGSSVADRIFFAGERLVEQGREQGRLEGERRTLLRLLSQRFGALPNEVVARVEAADQNELDRMTSLVLTAATLEDVLNRKRRRRGAGRPGP